jgi:hypothetical protein
MTATQHIYIPIFVPSVYLSLSLSLYFTRVSQTPPCGSHGVSRGSGPGTELANLKSAAGDPVKKACDASRKPPHTPYIKKTNKCDHRPPPRGAFRPSRSPKPESYHFDPPRSAPAPPPRGPPPGRKGGRLATWPLLCWIWVTGKAEKLPRGDGL